MANEFETKDPKSLFLQLFAVIALYISYSSLLTLCFSYVDLHGKSPVYFELSLMRFSLSSLMIGFLVYAICCFVIKKAQMPTRKFFVYLTLFLGALMLCSKAINLLFTLLSGSLNTEFMLKVVILLLTTLGVSWFYLKESKQNIAYQRINVFMTVAAIIVLAVLVYGFYLIAGSAK